MSPKLTVIKPPEVQPSLHPLTQTCPTKANLLRRRLQTAGVARGDREGVVVEVCAERPILQPGEPAAHVGEEGRVWVVVEAVLPY